MVVGGLFGESSDFIGRATISPSESSCRYIDDSGSVRYETRYVKDLCHGDKDDDNEMAKSISKIDKKTMHEAELIPPGPRWHGF